jgi:Tol biopolymer transport system component
VISSKRVGKFDQIYVVRVSDGHAVRLTHDKRFDLFPHWSPNGKWIAYSSHRKLYYGGDLVVMRPDGSGKRMITHSREASFPAWSPDSNRLVYTRFSSNSGLHVIDRTGRHDQNLTGSPRLVGYDAFWGKDGTIFFDASPGESDQIATVTPDGGDLELLTSSSDWHGDPRWSPDGKQLVFSSDITGNSEVYTMGADGSGLRNLTEAPNADDYEPAWSPDSNRIVFASDRGSAHNDSEIFSMKTDGTDQVNLSRSPADDYDPAYSPDGKRIAFSRFTSDEAGDIWVMNADGSNQTRLTFDEAANQEPVWSPDGSKILFASYRGKITRLWVMNADGTNQHQLDTGHADAEPAWSPDGTQIVFDRYTKRSIEIVVAQADGSGAHTIAIACLDDCEDEYPDPSWQATP